MLVSPPVLQLALTVEFIFATPPVPAFAVTDSPIPPAVSAGALLFTVTVAVDVMGPVTFPALSVAVIFTLSGDPVIDPDGTTQVAVHVPEA